MSRIRKALWVIERKLIGFLNFLPGEIYMPIYNKYLKRIGVQIKGAKYIDPSAHFDGVDYSIITLGTDVVISREVLLLTHDYSITRGFQAIGKYKGEVREVLPINIGNNSFIGARATLLPGTTIGKNCIVGAGAVVKGKIPSNSIVVGNPAKVIGNTVEWAEKKMTNIT